MLIPGKWIGSLTLTKLTIKKLSFFIKIHFQSIWLCNIIISIKTTSQLYPSLGIQSILLDVKFIRDNWLYLLTIPNFGPNCKTSHSHSRIYPSCCLPTSLRCILNLVQMMSGNRLKWANVIPCHSWLTTKEVAEQAPSYLAKAEIALMRPPSASALMRPTTA